MAKRKVGRPKKVEPVVITPKIKGAQEKVVTVADTKDGEFFIMDGVLWQSMNDNNIVRVDCGNVESYDDYYNHIAQPVNVEIKWALRK